MIILTTEDGFVDFEAPIHVTDEQKEKIIQFFKVMFGEEFQTAIVKDNMRVVGKHSVERKKWTADDYYALLTSFDDDRTLALQLGRNPKSDSVGMKRADFKPKFLVWLRNKGYDGVITKKIVDDFIEEIKK